MSIDLTNPVQTRDGQPVRILSLNGSPTYPVVGIIGGNKNPTCWLLDGRYAERGAAHNDLVNVPPARIKGWINIYPQNHIVGLHKTREDADWHAVKNRIACIYVEAEEGQGL